MALTTTPGQTVLPKIENVRVKTPSERARDTINESLSREQDFAALDDYIGRERIVV